MYLYAFTLILTTADWQACFSDREQLDLASWSGSSAWAGAALSIVGLRRLSDDRKHAQYKMLEVAMFTRLTLKASQSPATSLLWLYYS